MKYKVVAILIALACCSGCVSRSTKDQAGNTVGQSRTVWFWQKDFWGSK